MTVQFQLSNIRDSVSDNCMASSFLNELDKII